MNRPQLTQLTFLFAGFASGVVTVVVGRFWPIFLAVGVGLLFAGALLAAIFLTRSQAILKHVVWRYFVGLTICAVGYVLALFTLVVLGQYAQSAGLPPSSDIVELQGDMLIALTGATLVSALFVELLAHLLTGRWSTAFLLRLMAAGFVTVLVTFVANLPFHHYWSLMGTLLPVGEALFCWIVGLQIWQSGANQFLTQPSRDSRWCRRRTVAHRS